MMATAKVKVSFWTYPSIIVEGLEPGEYEQKVIDQFEKEYPEVDIVLEVIPYEGGTEKVNLSIVSGTPPDIISDALLRVGNYASFGLLVPFDLTEQEKNDFFPFVIEASSFNGKMYYYPIGIQVQGLSISKKLAREAGVLDLLPFDRPDRHWTADEFKIFLQKIASAKLPGVYSIGMHFGDATSQQFYVMLMCQGFGAKPFTLENGKWKCTLNSPEGIEGLEYYLDIYNNSPGCFPEGVENMSYLDLDNLNANNKLVVYLWGITQIIEGIKGNNQLAADLELALFPIPSKEGIPNSILLAWCGFGVFDNHDKEKAKYAQMFVRYFCENAPDILVANQNVSPVKKSTPKPFQEFKDNPEVQYYLTEFAKFNKDFGATTPVYGQYKIIFSSVMQGVFTGELTAKEGLDEVTNKVNKLLDEFYAK
jgi:multiple sugar transport system substrate-binding protein